MIFQKNLEFLKLTEIESSQKQTEKNQINLRRK